jgi:secondary thiamine-phosphate synthase enzyme
VDLTAAVQAVVAESSVREGLCNVFCHHTSASVIVCENADPEVLADLERFASRLVPDGDPLFQHDAEGPDDMPAHVRSVLTQTSISIPVQGGRCAFGTWQGLYLWEHRRAAHTRRVTVSVVGS